MCRVQHPAVVSTRRTRQLVELAASRGGLLRTSDLDDLALSPRLLSELTRSGVFVRLAPGAYRLAAHDGRGAIVAALAQALGGWVSHHSAARHFGVDTSPWPPAGEHLTVGAGREARRTADVVVHRTAFVRPVDVWCHRSVNVTSPARTLVDLAVPRAELTDDQLVDCFDELVRRRLLTPATMQTFLREAPKLHGRARMQRVFDLAVDSPTESAAERRLLGVVKAAGLPPPVTQHVVRRSDGSFLGRLDAAWVTERVGVEVDGFRYHGGSRDFRRDRERATRIQAEGWRLYRTTPAELADGAPELVEALRRELGLTG